MLNNTLGFSFSGIRNKEENTLNVPNYSKGVYGSLLLVNNLSTINSNTLEFVFQSQPLPLFNEQVTLLSSSQYVS